MNAYSKLLILAVLFVARLSNAQTTAQQKVGSQSPLIQNTFIQKPALPQSWTQQNPTQPLRPALKALDTKIRLQTTGPDISGGGKPTNRMPLTKDQIKLTLQKIYAVSKYNFIFLENNMREQEVLEKIKIKVQENPDLFQKISLNFAENGASCYYANGETAPATYSNGVICFEINTLFNFGYNQSEAEVKLMALYMHEVGHAAGLTHSATDEEKLNQFQTAVEKVLIQFDFTLANFENRLKNPLHYELDPRFGLGPKIAALARILPNDSTSNMWVCSRLQSVRELLAEIPIENRQGSKGLSLFTDEEESLMDLYSWEAVALTFVHCPDVDLEMDLDKSDEENLQSLRSSKSASISVHEFIYKYLRPELDFCESYSQRVCAHGKSTQVRLHIQNWNEAKMEIQKFANRVITFLESK